MDADRRGLQGPRHRSIMRVWADESGQRTTCPRSRTPSAARDGPIDLGSAPPTPCSTRARRRRHAPGRRLDAPAAAGATRWPTWCGPFRNGPRRGRRWARWPATTSRPTPASGSGYHRGLDALRRAGWRGSGYVRWAHPGNRGLPPLRRRAAGHGGRHRRDRPRRSGARCSSASSTRRGPRPGLAGPGRPVTGAAARCCSAAALALASCGSPFPGRTSASRSFWATTDGLAASLEHPARRRPSHRRRRGTPRSGRRAHRLRRARQRRARAPTRTSPAPTTRSPGSSPPPTRRIGRRAATASRAAGGDRAPADARVGPSSPPRSRATSRPRRASTPSTPPGPASSS